MTKRRFTPVESAHAEPVKQQPVRKHVQAEPSQPNNYKTLFIVACVVILVLGYLAFFGNKGGGSIGSISATKSELTTVLGTTYIELSKTNENIPDPDEPGTKVTYWRFSDLIGNNAYCTILSMPEPFPNMLLVTDINLKIMKVKNITDFSKAGSDRRAEYIDMMSRYEGRSLLDFSTLERAYDEGEMRQFREMLRDRIAIALKVMYINEMSYESFKSMFPQGIKFSRVGSKLEPWVATTEDGREINSSMFAGKKYAFLSASACGSCRATITEISQDMRTTGNMDPSQIILIFTGKPEEKSKMKTNMAGEYLILDPDQSSFCKKISFTDSSPSALLIDQNGMVFGKEGPTGLNDIEARRKLLEGFYNAR
jgi:hypothetical protein